MEAAKRRRSADGGRPAAGPEGSKRGDHDAEPDDNGGGAVTVVPIEDACDEGRAGSAARMRRR